MSYYSISAILTSAQKVPCTFDLPIPNLGFLDDNPGGDVRSPSCPFPPPRRDLLASITSSPPPSSPLPLPSPPYSPSLLLLLLLASITSHAIKQGHKKKLTTKNLNRSQPTPHCPSPSTSPNCSPSSNSTTDRSSRSTCPPPCSRAC